LHRFENFLAVLQYFDRLCICLQKIYNIVKGYFISFVSMNVQKCLEYVCEWSSDEVYFRVIFDTYHQKISAYVFSLCKDNASTVEIVSNIRLIVATKIGSLKRPIQEVFECWLFRIAKSRTLDYLWQSSHMRYLDTESLQDIAVSTESRPDQLASIEYEYTYLLKLMQSLPESQAACMRLKYISWLSNKQIASFMWLQEKTVSWHISRWRKTMSEQYLSV